MKIGMIISQIILTAFLGFFLVKANAQVVEAPTKKQSRKMICTEVGFAAAVDLFSMTCKNKHRKLNITFAGVGGLSLHSGVGILYPKKGSRLLKPGTYRNSTFGAVHLGMGVMALKFQNDNESIDYRVKGLTLGLGVNGSAGIIMVEEVTP